MKNLICTMLFLAIATFTAQAQLTATLINATTNPAETWFLRVEDSQTPPVSLQVGPIAPGNSTSNTASTVIPQFLLNAGDYNTGCSVTWLTDGIPSSGTVTNNCNNTITYSVAYSTLAPTGYTIKVQVK